ncbi:MAG: hypothetical protein KIC94_12235 [Clostridiales bacterium]|nr:hypothetical protein [Clostridiales bacterium]
MRDNKFAESAAIWYGQFDIIGTAFVTNEKMLSKQHKQSRKVITVCNILDQAQPILRYSYEEYASCDKSMLLVTFGFNEVNEIYKKDVVTIPCKILLELSSNIPLEKSDYMCIVSEILNIKYDMVSNRTSKLETDYIVSRNEFLYKCIHLISECMDMVIASGMLYDFMLEVKIYPILQQMFSKGFRVDIQGLKQEYQMIKNENEIMQNYLIDHYSINPNYQDSLSRITDSNGVQVLERYQKNQRLLQTYGEKRLLKRIKKGYQEYISCSYKQIGTKTLRISTHDINLYGLPKRLRQHLIPLEGNVFVEADYHASELIIIAQLAHEEWIVRAYEQGRDIYRLFGAYFFGKKESNVLENERKAMKKLFFAKINGARERTLHRIMLDNGIDMSDYELIRGLSLLLAKIPNIERYLRSLRYKQNVITPSGRHWSEEDLPKYYKRAAYIIQTTESEILFNAILGIHQEVLKYDGIRLYLTKHDSITLETPLQYVDIAMKILKTKMTEALQNFFPNQKEIKISMSVSSINERKKIMKNNYKNNNVMTKLNFDVNTVSSTMSHFKSMNTTRKSVSVVRFQNEVTYLAVVYDHKYIEGKGKYAITFNIFVGDKTRKYTEWFNEDTLAVDFYYAMIDTLTDGNFDKVDIIGKLCYVVFHKNEGFTNIEVLDTVTEEELGIQVKTYKGGHSNEDMIRKESKRKTALIKEDEDDYEDEEEDEEYEDDYEDDEIEEDEE